MVVPFHQSSEAEPKRRELAQEKDELAPGLYNVGCFAPARGRPVVERLVAEARELQAQIGRPTGTARSPA